MVSFSLELKPKQQLTTQQDGPCLHSKSLCAAQLHYCKSKCKMDKFHLSEVCSQAGWFEAGFRLLTASSL